MASTAGISTTPFLPLSQVRFHNVPCKNAKFHKLVSPKTCSFTLFVSQTTKKQSFFVVPSTAFASISSKISNSSTELPKSATWQNKTGASLADRLKPAAVAIIGGHVAGSFAALLLAKQGWDVALFDRRTWLDEKERSGWEEAEAEGGEPGLVGSGIYTCGVRLSAQSMWLLEQAGCHVAEAVTKAATVCHGRLTHTGQDAPQHYQPFNYRLLTISENELSSVIIQTAIQNFPSRITLYSGSIIDSIDFESNQISWRQPRSSSETRHLVTDMIVGSDGPNSRIRSDLENAVEGFHVETQSRPAGRMFRLQIPPEFRINYENSNTYKKEEDYKKLRFGSFQIALVRPGKVFLGLPFRDGSMGVTVQGIRGRTAIEVEKEIGQNFPELAELFSGNSENCSRLAAAEEQQNFSVKVSSFNYKNTVLLGDAAHSMFNILGFGPTLELEDSFILFQLLEKELKRRELQKLNESIVTGAQKESSLEENGAEEEFFLRADDANIAVAASLAKFSTDREWQIEVAADLAEKEVQKRGFLSRVQHAFMTSISRRISFIRPWQASINASRASMPTIAFWKTIETFFFRVAVGLTAIIVGLRFLSIFRNFWRLAVRAFGRLV